MKSKTQPKKSKKEPYVGQKIYVPGHISIEHGLDDVAGGRATISKITRQNWGACNYIFVDVLEVPNDSWNWDLIKEEQEELKKEYGKQKAHPEPDYGEPDNVDKRFTR
jgi:hypothetical protein